MDLERWKNEATSGHMEYVTRDNGLTFAWEYVTDEGEVSTTDSTDTVPEVTPYWKTPFTNAASIINETRHVQHQDT